MSISELEIQSKGRQRLTTKRIAEALCVLSGTIVVLAALGIYEFRVRHYFLASYAFVGVVVLAFRLLIRWKQYRPVKSGAIVYAAPTQSDLQRVFLALSTEVVVYITISNFNTQIGWTFCLVALSAVWLFTDHGLHRIFPKKPPLAQEQLEGVWPPAPSVSPRGEENKERLK